MNPFGLSDRQCEVLDAIVATGTAKGAANALGITSKGVDAHFFQCQLKIGGRNRLLTMLQWDRVRRTAASEVPGGR